jgi:hypothetical protein
MGRPAVRVVSMVALAAALAGCGGGETSPPAPADSVPPAPAPLSLSPAERAACDELERSIRVVSQVISSSVELMTQSLRPKELARRTGATQENLISAANALAQIRVPQSLEAAEQQLVVGLREFAADFGRARRSVERNDLASASRQLTDPQALGNVTAATQAIDRTCGA